MLKFVTVICVLLNTCLISLSFWRNIIKYHRWYENETKTCSTLEFIGNQICRVVVSLSIPIILYLFNKFAPFCPFESFVALMVLAEEALVFGLILEMTTLNKLPSSNPAKRKKDKKIRKIGYVILFVICLIDIRNIHAVEVPSTLIKTSKLENQFTSLDENALDLFLNNTYRVYYYNNAILCKPIDGETDTNDANSALYSNEIVIISDGKVSTVKNNIKSTPENCKHIGLTIDDSQNVYEVYAHLKKDSFLGKYYIDMYMFYNVETKQIIKSKTF